MTSQSAISELTEARDRERLRLEMLQARQEADQLERSSRLLEQFGSMVPLSDYPQFEPFRGGDDEGLVPDYFPSRIDDRTEGRNRPIYETEIDLAQMRGEARALSAFASLTIGALESLVNYTLGEGFTPIVEPREGLPVPPGLVASLQSVIDQFDDDNSFRGCLDQEVHNRSREDGEAILALYPDRAERWRAQIKLIEPDQLTEPANPRPIEDWLGISESHLSFWHMGVHTVYDPDMRCENADKPLGYHIVFDNAGYDWDYLPASRVVHVKRNVYRRVKRGVSDFVSIAGDVKRESKLRRNLSVGAALQSAIAFIREHVQGATPSGVQALVAGNAAASVNRPTSTGSKQVKLERMSPGTIKDIPAGMKYHAGPLGTLNHPVFIEVAQYLMRSIGVRWSMPEYMISGDASNANFASTVVSESPFVKARERDQSFYSRAFSEVYWKALRIAFDAGYFSRFGINRFSDLRGMVTIRIDAPDVASRDRLQQAQVLQMELQAGVIDRETWAAETGRDPEKVASIVAPSSSPPTSGGPVAALEITRQELDRAETLAERKAIIEAIWRHYP